MPTFQPRAIHVVAGLTLASGIVVAMVMEGAPSGAGARRQPVDGKKGVTATTRPTDCGLPLLEGKSFRP